MKTILVVDDDTEVRAALAELIEVLFNPQAERPSVRVATAATGEEAVRAATAGRPPEIIVMDVHLPGIDGVEAFFRITAARGEPVPTLFVTGYAGSGPLHTRLAEALRGGAIAVLSKPVTAAALAAQIGPVLAATPSG